MIKVLYYQQREIEPIREDGVCVLFFYFIFLSLFYHSELMHMTEPNIVLH